MGNTKVSKACGVLCALSSMLTLAMMVLVPAQASAAETPKHCIDIIGDPYTQNTVRGNLAIIHSKGGIGGNNAQQTYESLESKLSGAITKIQQKKYIPDADKKLSDFIDQVKYISDPLLTPKVKLGSEEANILLNGLNPEGFPDDIGAVGARNCVRDLP